MFTYSDYIRLNVRSHPFWENTFCHTGVSSFYRCSFNKTINKIIFPLHILQPTQILPTSQKNVFYIKWIPRESM